MKKTMICAILCVLLISVFGVGGDSSVSFRVTTSWGRFSNPIWFIGTTSQFTTFPLVWPPLVWTDSRGNIVPWYADSYEVSSDATTYTFYLPRDGRWTDGVPVTADDFKFTFELIFSKRAFEEGCHLYSWLGANKIKGAEAYFNGEAEEIIGIKVIDPYTLKIELVEPDLGFLIRLAAYPATGVQPKHVLGRLSWDEFLSSSYLKDPDVTAGPYKFVEFKREQYIILEAREDDGWPHKKPQIKTLYALPLSGFETYETMLEAKQLDIGYIRVSEMERMSKLPYLTIKPQSTLGWGLVIGVNCARVSDKRVRQAVMYALDREAIVEAMTGGLVETIDSPIFAPEWAVSPNLVHYEYDPDKARKLLAEANWDPNRELVWICTSSETSRNLAQIIQAYLADVGVKMRIEMGTYQEVVNRWQQGDFDFYPLGGGVPGLDPSIALDYLRSEPSPNLYNYSNERINELAREGVRTPDLERRQAIYWEASEILNDELPFIPVYREVIVYAVNKRVLNFDWPLSPYQLLTCNVLDWQVVDE
ncbi:TPA: hypothetical protein DCL37_02745 [Candidatus Acetothermia bacterium]|nr:hypothetical protein [Candidatus Acetothermia bacterium]